MWKRWRNPSWLLYDGSKLCPTLVAAVRFKEECLARRNCLIWSHLSPNSRAYLFSGSAKCSLKKLLKKYMRLSNGNKRECSGTLRRILVWSSHGIIPSLSLGDTVFVSGKDRDPASPVNILYGTWRSKVIIRVVSLIEQFFCTVHSSLNFRCTRGTYAIHVCVEHNLLSTKSLSTLFTRIEVQAFKWDKKLLSAQVALRNIDK